MPESTRWFAIAALVVATDQLTKWAVLAFFEGDIGPRVEITPFFNLVLAFNKGAAFSLLANAAGWQQPLLALIAVAASIVLGVLIVRNAGKRRLCVGLACVLGGALGNLIDRLRFGHVVDFLDFHALGWHWPAFNVADTAITVGAVLLVADSLLTREAAGAG